MAKWTSRSIKRDRGVAVILTLIVMSSLLLGGVISSGMRMSTLRASSEGLTGKRDAYCAEAGLAAGRDFFRARANQWEALIQANYVYPSGQPAGTGLVSIPGRPVQGTIVRIRDNRDEAPPVPNNPLDDIDQTVIIEAGCVDPANVPSACWNAANWDNGTCQLASPTMRQYLTLNPVDPARLGIYESRGSVTYTDTINPGGPSYSGGGSVDPNNGRLINPSGGFNPSGIRSIGTDIRYNQLALSTADSGLPFIWYSNSGDGTISKLNTNTGVEVARYRTGPAYGNPSRVTVDMNGDVWVGNRNNNTITKIGLREAGNCVDRNGDNLISTSSGPLDVKAWSGTWGGGVAGAEDECILQHRSVSYPGVSTPSDIRMLAVDRNNHIFVGGLTASAVFKMRTEDGVIIAARDTHQGHYGGVVDRQGNLWSMHAGTGHVQKISNDLLSALARYPIGHAGYGITLDRNGRVWTSEWGSRFSRMNLDGSGLVVYNRAFAPGMGQGLVSTRSGDIYISYSLSGDYVDQYDNNGNFVHRYHVPGGPTGVTIDAEGKLWTSNYRTGDASRLDPVARTVTTFPIGPNPYNYSDMTGYIAFNITSRQGTWNVRQYCGGTCTHWESIKWKLVRAMPAGTEIAVRARAAYSLPALALAPWRTKTPTVNFLDYEMVFPKDATGLPGTIIEVEVRLRSDSDTTTPEIDSVTITPY